MNIEAKIQNPLNIKIGKDSNIILGDKEFRDDIPIENGVMIGNEHFGFSVIINYNGKQKEFFYPTQSRIIAVEKKYGLLKVYEEGKKLPWELDSNGKMNHSTFNEFTKEYLDKLREMDLESATPVDEPTLKDPLIVKISRNPEKSVIIRDKNSDDIPLHPGAMIGDVHYGFILIIDTDKVQKEIAYPTQNRIDAIGIEGSSWLNDLKIFENGKYHPWLFTYDGKFKQEASYNPHSRRDIEFISNCDNLNKGSLVLNNK